MIVICGECLIPEVTTEKYVRFPSESRCPLCAYYYCSNQKCLKRLEKEFLGVHSIKCGYCFAPHTFLGKGKTAILHAGFVDVPNEYS